MGCEVWAEKLGQKGEVNSVKEQGCGGIKRAEAKVKVGFQGVGAGVAEGDKSWIRQQGRGRTQRGKPSF